MSTIHNGQIPDRLSKKVRPVAVRCRFDFLRFLTLQARNRTLSIPQVFVHNLEQRLTCPKPLKLRNELIHRLLEPVGRIVSAVRGKQDIVQLVECVSEEHTSELQS